MSSESTPQPPPPTTLDIKGGSTGTFVEFRGGELDGQMLHLPLVAGLRPAAFGGAAEGGYRPPTPYRHLAPHDREIADLRADRLLTTLLDPHQRRDHAASGGFWVDLHTAGRIRFGRLHHLIHRPSGGRYFERVLCVVPESFGSDPTPPGDVWTGLLLAVRNDPDHFFDTANVLATRPRADSDRSFDSIGTDSLLRLSAGHYREGRIVEGADAEAEYARRCEARGSLSAAAPAGVRAAMCRSLAPVGPNHPSDVERSDRCIATAERLVDAVGATAAQLASWRDEAMAHPWPSDRIEDARHHADTLIAVWNSST